MRNACYKRVFENMRERAMPNIVKQYGYLHGLNLTIEDENALLLKRQYGLAYQMESSNGMQETRVLRTWINHRGHPQLANTRKALHQGMANNIEN